MTVNWQNRIWEISTMQNETIKVLGFRRSIVTSNDWGSAAFGGGMVGGLSENDGQCAAEKISTISTNQC